LTPHFVSEDFMRGRRGDVRAGAVKALLLACGLSLPALGGISDARSASGPAPPPFPAASSSAMTPPWLDTPGDGIVPDVPADSSSEPKPTPLQAPAVTNHYASSAENSYI